MTASATRNGASSRQGLAAHVEVLETARRAVRAGETGAAASARRIARAIHLIAAEHGNPDVAQFADLLRQSPDSELAERLDLLAATIRGGNGSSEEPPVTVLAIEDDPFFRGLLSAALLRPGRDVVFAGSVAEAERVIGQRPLALVILDLGLPDADGRELLLRLRADPRTVSLPILVVSGRGETLSRAECFALGADAYFEKPVQLEALSAAVAARLRRNGTGAASAPRSTEAGGPLLTRGEFHQAFLRVQQASRDVVLPASLALVDLDLVREVNATYGHPAGDAVIHRAVAVLAEVLGSGAAITRWTSEEIGILLPATSQEAARDLLRRGLAEFCSRRFDAPGRAGRSFTASFTAGVALVPPGATFPLAFARAESILKFARAAGRNVVLGAPPSGPARPRVLVVEDDDLAAAMIRHLLIQEGYEAVVCSTGADALARAQDAAPVLVLLAAPFVGEETAAFIARFRELPGVGRRPILAMQVRRDPRDMARLLDLGVQDVIAKPLPPVEFLARVHQLVGAA